MRKLLTIGLLLCAAVTGFSQITQQHKYQSFITGFEPQPGNNPSIFAGQTVAVALSMTKRERISSAVAVGQTSTGRLAPVFSLKGNRLE